MEKETTKWLNGLSLCRKAEVGVNVELMLMNDEINIGSEFDYGSYLFLYNYYL